jgi:hypothetical protein
MTMCGYSGFEPGHIPDISIPSAARMYDYWLGGKNNFKADREAADKVIAAYPETRRLALANRRFLTRAVWYLAEHGVRQFIDLGSGLPTSPNVHEVARQVRSDARVVYVDSDPVVASHGRFLCDAESGVGFVEQDIRNPRGILGDVRLERLIDFSAPVAVLAVAVLHFMPDEDEPGEILAAFRSPMAPGSYLVLSHATSDGADERVLSEIASAYKKSTVRAVPRTAADIKGFFDGLDLIEPGLVDVSQWRGDMPAKPTKIRFLAGVGRKPRELPRPVNQPGRPRRLRGPRHGVPVRDGRRAAHRRRPQVAHRYPDQPLPGRHRAGTRRPPRPLRRPRAERAGLHRAKGRAAAPVELPRDLGTGTRDDRHAGTALPRPAPYRQHDGRRPRGQPQGTDGADGPLKPQGRTDLPARDPRARPEDRGGHGQRVRRREED